MTLFFAYLLPLMLPTVIYMLWRIWRERAAAAGSVEGTGEVPPHGGSATVPARDIRWRDAPWPWLAAAGIALMALVMLMGVFVHGSAPTGRYVPPHMENGRVVPGELRPAEPGAGAPREPDRPR